MALGEKLDRAGRAPGPESRVRFPMRRLPNVQPISPEKMLVQFRDLLTPKYIPDGYHLESASTVNGIPNLHYLGTPPLGDAETQVRDFQLEAVTTRRLIIGRYSEFTPRVPPGFWTRVSVGGADSILIRGMWHGKYGKDGALQKSGWNVDLVTRLLVERDEWIYQLMSIPGSALDEQSLMEVGASLSRSE